MKKLRENFTDAEHAAWVRHIDKKNNRDDIIHKVMVCCIGGGFLWYVYSVSKPQEWDTYVLYMVFGYIAYVFEQRLDKIIGKLEAIEESLRLQ